MYVYLVEAYDAVCALLANRKGKHCPVHYVSMILHEAKMNYVLLKELPLSLLHASQRLHRYFEARLIKVITDKPIKQILNKVEASDKLEKHAIELRAYDITYEPQNAVKG
ncbi:reverse transcriptase domain-containing protein [Tanacetum coccineum]